MFTFKHITPELIHKKLLNLDIRKATGYDNIPAKLLRLGCNHLCLPIANLINTCMDKSIFPATMKRGELSPVYKKSDNLIKKLFSPCDCINDYF